MATDVSSGPIFLTKTKTKIKINDWNLSRILMIIQDEKFCSCNLLRKKEKNQKPVSMVALKRWINEKAIS